jgi:23S rRNA pseudouridine1911/1915/1917 synthase
MTQSNPNVDESPDLYEHFRFIVDKGQALLRIDKYLSDKIENASRTRIQNAANAGSILVNEVIIKPNYRVKPGDIISIVLPHPPRDSEIYPENIPVDILYEDQDIIVVNKEAGMVVHPGHGNFTGTLQNALLYHFRETAKDKADARVYLVHRIDKDTSGVLLVAKNEIAQIHLAKQFFEHTINRTYIALVWGNLKNDEGTITGFIARDPRDRLVMKIFEDEEKGRNSITHYKVIERFGYVTLVECVLETGRTHQIRAHFKHLGHPLFNDEKYGGNEILKGTTFTKYKQFILNCFKLMPRQALHAKSLGFQHPISRNYLYFDSNYPDDLKAVLEKWRTYSIHKAFEEE